MVTFYFYYKKLSKKIDFFIARLLKFIIFAIILLGNYAVFAFHMKAKTAFDLGLSGINCAKSRFEPMNGFGFPHAFA